MDAATTTTNSSRSTNNRTKAIVTTAAVYYLFMQLAIRFGMFGPTLIDLQNNLMVTQETMSIVFSVTSAGVCIGAFASGFLFKWINRQVAVSVIVLILGVQVTLVTSITDFRLFVGWQLVIGITSGAAISACEAWILDIWTDACAPFMQALQLFRGVGYIIGPLLAEPFLATEDPNDSDQDNDDTFPYLTLDKPWNKTLGNLTVDVTETSTISHFATQAHESSICLPYLANGLMIILGGAITMMLYWLLPKQHHYSSNLSAVNSQDTIVSVISSGDLSKKPMTETVKADTNNNQQETVDNKIDKKSLPQPYVVWIILLSSLFYLFFFEEVVVTYLASFATNIDLRLTKSEGAFLTSVFNLANIFGKLVGVFAAIWLSPLLMLYLDLAIIISSLLVLLVFANSSAVLLWLGVALLGFGLASVIAALYALMEQIIEMSSFICGVLNMSGTLGSVFMPLVLAGYIERYPISLIWASLFCSACCVVLLIAVHTSISSRSRTLKLKKWAETDYRTFGAGAY